VNQLHRLRLLRHEDLDAEQLALWDELTAARSRADHIDETGALIGPFNAFVHAAELWRRLMPVGTFLRSDTSVERRLLELAICTVAVHWRAEFAMWQHAPMAIESGVEPDVIEALQVGRPPKPRRDDERLVHALTIQLLNEHSVDDETYSAAHDLLGDRGIVELATTIGFYGLIAQLLVLFEVPVPQRSES
jgi:4-carboxymuconolactone decarboxylase